MPEEVHITSLVVHSTPRRLQRVSERIAAMPGARVHGSSPNGKLVVTLDANSADEMLARVSEIQRTDGVLSAALVYQYADGPEATTAEVCDAG
ncbi:MAG: chaperone NapD [Burkholderiales bacterium]|nr:chaperone NapD [Burkholderiales bacterium]